MKRNRTLSSISGSNADGLTAVKRVARAFMAACLMGVAMPLQAQDTQKDEFVDNGPLYRGTILKVDIAGLAGHYLISSDYNSAEVAASVNLKNRYFPTLEVGYGKIDTTDDENDVHFNTSAPYFRVGCDYNMMWKKPYLPGHLTLGLRYGFTSMSYDVDGPSLTDPNWTVDEVPIRYEGISGSASWLEFVIGVECRVYKRFHMGWNLRYRSRLSTPSSDNTEPHYIPGFGKNGKTGLGVCYNLIYELPF